MNPLARPSRRPLLGSIAALLIAASCGAAAVSPQDSMWQQNPGTNSWNFPSDWTPAAVPTGTATFGTSATTGVSVSSSATVNNIVFNAGGSAFTISMTNDASLTINGAGITNNSGVTQNFVNVTDTSGNAGGMYFMNSASAGSGVTITNQGALVATGFSAGTYFENTSTAGSATIINIGNSVVVGSSSNYGGYTSFGNTASAGNATLIALGGTNGGAGGEIFFFNQATGGTAKVILSGNGTLDVSGLNNATTSTNVPSVTIGSLASGTGGGGIVSLGANNLAVGSDNTSTTFSGVIQDAGYATGTGGSFTKVGTGTLTLTGASTFTGGTTISGGLINFNSLGNFGTGKIALNGGGLQWATGTTTDVSSKLTAIGSGGATFDTNGSNVTFASPLTGTGGVTKAGLGSLDLTGNSTYRGSTVINGGSLFVDGSITSPVTVGSAGLLGGHGLIVGNVINNGNVSPGNSPGTLTINGNYTQNSSGKLTIEIAGLGAGQHDLLAVSGTANLGGTLQVQYLNGFKFGKNQTVTLLTAGQGVNGTFSTVQGLTDTGNVLTGQTIIYLPNAVEVSSGNGSIYDTINGLPGITQNDLQTAKMLDSASGDPRLTHLFSLLNGNNNVRGLIDDIKLIDPDRFAALSGIGTALSNTTLLSLEQRMQVLQSQAGAGGPSGPDGKGGKEIAPPAAPEKRWGFFITGSGDFEHVDSTAQSRGFNFDAGGFTLGADYRFSDHFVAGIYAGYTNTGIDIGDRGRIDVNDGKFGFYGTYMNGGFYINGVLGGGYSSYGTHRTGLAGTAHGDTDGGDFTALFAPGYNITRGPLTFGPTARFQYNYEGVNSFNESGSAAPMAISSQHNNSLVTGLGGKASYDCKLGSVTVRPEVLLEWEHEYGDTSTAIQGGLADGAGRSFGLRSTTIGRDDLHVGAGFAVILSESWTVYAYYDGQFFRTNYDSSTVTAGFRLSF